MDTEYTTLVLAGLQLAFYVWVSVWGLTLMWRLIVRWFGW
jgi:hypothetical protein